ncbi:MAG: serine/threonine protein kinase [Pseudomonadales bacterium]
MAQKFESFDLAPGRVIASKYAVVEKLGQGWEGEVYKIRELSSGIERAAKLFLPQRNPGNRSVKFYARKLHRLRQCSMVIQYHNEESFTFRGQRITMLISEFVDGTLLGKFVAQQPGKRLQPYEGLHLLYALSRGLEEIHQLADYHGDLHEDNVIVERYGVAFELRLLDMFYWGSPKPVNYLDDTVDLVKIFYDALGGQRHYASHPQWVKDICCGLKRSLIRKKFRTAGQLRAYLENMSID